MNKDLTKGPIMSTMMHFAVPMILGITLLLNGIAFACLDGIRIFLQVPDKVWGSMREYLVVIFGGIMATFLYNYYASFLRAIGNSVVPLVFLAVSAVLNIALDLWFILGLRWGVSGAARHFEGSGTRQQLRCDSYGSICGWC